MTELRWCWHDTVTACATLAGVAVLLGARKILKKPVDSSQHVG